MNLVVEYHQLMFKPFKLWADYDDCEHIMWSTGLPTDCFDKVIIPETEQIKPKKLQIFTPVLRQNLNEMTLSKSQTEETRKQTLMDLMTPKTPRRSSTSSNSDGSITPTSPMLMRKLSLDKFKPIMSPKTLRPRRKS